MMWCRKAADQGYAAAEYSLGLMYENGLAVAKDISQAVAWYSKAADQGYALAQGKLAELSSSKPTNTPFGKRYSIYPRDGRWYICTGSWTPSGGCVGSEEVINDRYSRPAPRYGREPVLDRTWYVRNGSWYECTGTLTSNGSCIGSEREVISPGYPHETIPGDTYYFRNGQMYECSGILSSNDVCIGTESNH